jgi:CBS domain-containing protein
LWIARRTPAALLYADIFFDFEAIWGDPAPAAELRASLAAALARHPGFAGAMLGEDRRLHVALGFFGRIVTQGAGGHAGEVDLKLNGTMPLVAAVRLQALARGIVETGTRARIAGLVAQGALTGPDAAALDGAFATLTALILRAQLADAREGRVPGNFVRPAALSKADRAALSEALRVVDDFLARTRADFTGRLLG